MTNRERLGIADYQQQVADSIVVSEYGILRDGLIEETRELLVDGSNFDQFRMTRLLSGDEKLDDAGRQIREKARSEIGDILWYLTAISSFSKLSIHQSCEEYLAKVVGSRNLLSELRSFEDLDESLVDRVSEQRISHLPVAVDDRVFWGFPVLEPRKENGYVDVSYSEGFDFMRSGRYVISFAIREVLERIGLEPESHKDEGLSKKIGVAVCALSAFSQFSFGLTLEDVAEVNLAKVNRRKNAGTLLSGPDPDREDESVERTRQRNLHGFPSITLDCNFSGLVTV